MKKVEMKVSIASAYWSYYPGQKVLVDDELAKSWEEVGHCEILEDVPEQTEENVSEDITDKITSLGGGWFEVPDGNRFRGKNAAIEYLKNLPEEVNGGVADGGDNAPKQTNATDTGTADTSTGEATS